MAFTVTLTVIGRCQVWRKNKSLVTRGIRSLLARQRGQRGNLERPLEERGTMQTRISCNVPQLVPPHVWQSAPVEPKGYMTSEQ